MKTARDRALAPQAMGKIPLTPDEAALLRHIGSNVAGPRHTLTLPADRRIAELVGELVHKGLAESTGYVLRTAETELLRVRLTGKGWVRLKGPAS